jgi:hypothetical protein
MILWARERARRLGYWREVVLKRRVSSRVGMYALEEYGIFNVRFVFFYVYFLTLIGYRPYSPDIEPSYYS